jgi:hypothetical protein
MDHSVYVHPDRRGQAVGCALMDNLIQQATAASIWTIQTGIFPQNSTSLALHRACGFRFVGRRERLGQLNGPALGRLQPGEPGPESVEGAGDDEVQRLTDIGPWGGRSCSPDASIGRSSRPPTCAHARYAAAIGFTDQRRVNWLDNPNTRRWPWHELGQGHLSSFSKS